MSLVTVVLTALSFVAWASAAVHGLWSLAHLSGKSSLAQMLFYGTRWFDSKNYTPRGQVLQRRFVLSCAAFAGSILCVIAAAVLGLETH